MIPAVLHIDYDCIEEYLPSHLVSPRPFQFGVLFDLSDVAVNIAPHKPLLDLDVHRAFVDSDHGERMRVVHPHHTLVYNTGNLLRVGSNHLLVGQVLHPGISVDGEDVLDLGIDGIHLQRGLHPYVFLSLAVSEVEPAVEYEEFILVTQLSLLWHSWPATTEHCCNSLLAKSPLYIKAAATDGAMFE